MNKSYEKKMQHKLLTAEEEKELARAIGRGRAAARKLAQAPRKPSRHQLAELQAEIRAGEAAREQFVMSNLRLVAMTAQKFGAVRTGGDGVAEEAFEDGIVGLYKAVDSFDWRRGFKFSTYAVWWIKKEMTAGFAKRGSGAPGDSTSLALESRANMVIAEDELCARLGRRPSDAELGEALNVSPVTIGHWRMPRPVSIDVASAVHRDRQREGVELSTELSAGNSAIEDEVLDGVVLEELRNAVARVLSVLTDEARSVVELKFGLSGKPPMSTERVAEELGFSANKVRRLWTRASETIATSDEWLAAKELVSA